jgi:DNA-binding transcriptional LysR family regulator
MFTLAQLENFVAVAEELHFGRAAERLRMTQPPLSRQIQILENGLQVQLLDRSSRRVHLTPAGHAFLGEARRLLKQAEHMAMTVRQFSSGEAGHITVGFTATSAYSMLATLLALARKELPKVEVVLREMVSRDQIQALNEGNLDLGLARPPVSGADLASYPTQRETLVVAIPLDHPLARLDGPVTPGDLDGQELIMYSPVEARYFHDLLISIFRTAGISPRFSQYLSQVHSILALVNAGWGIAVVPATAAQLRYPGLLFKEALLPDGTGVELHFAWRKDNENPALRALLGHLAGTGAGQ